MNLYYYWPGGLYAGLCVMGYICLGGKGMVFCCIGKGFSLKSGPAGQKNVGGRRCSVAFRPWSMSLHFVHQQFACFVVGNVLQGGQGYVVCGFLGEEGLV